MLQAVGAERAILSILMKEPQTLFDIDDVVSESDFTNSGAQIIYRLIKETLLEDRDATVDQYTLISKAEEKGVKDFISLTHNGDLLEALANTNVSPKTIGKHVNAVKSATIKRNSINMLDELKDEVEQYDGSAIDIKNMVEDRVFAEMRSIDTGDDSITRMDSNFEHTINQFAEHNALIGLDVGLPRWQRDAAALRNGTLTGLFARAKAGKSQFSGWCSIKAAVDQDIPTLYLDTELQLRIQQMRSTSIMTGIPFSRIESGAWKSNKEEVEKIKEAFAKIKDAPFYYKNIAGRSVNYVIPIIRKFFHKYVGKSEDDTVKCLVVYDYVKLMSMNDLKNAQEWQVLGFLMSKLHDVAAQLNIPILCLGQLNREALRMDNEFTVAGSDRIVHNLDSLTILRPKKPEEIDGDGKARGNYILKTAVARSGPGHSFDEHINLHFKKESGQFIEDKRNSEVIAALQSESPVADRLEDEDISPLGELRE